MNASTEIHVRVVCCRNLVDVQTFGTQDPFVKVSLGNRSFKTKVHDNGGRNPAWNEKFVFPVQDPQLNQLCLTVKNKNFTDSKLIGECRLPVSMFNHGNVVDQWYTLNKGSKRAGDINLRVQMLGPAVSQQKPAKAAQAAYNQPPPAYQQQPSAPMASAPGYPPQQQQPPPQYAQPQYAQAPAPQYAQAAAQPQYNPQNQMIQQQQQQIQQQQAMLNQQQQQMNQQTYARQQRPTYVQAQPTYVQQPPVVVAPPVVVQQPAVVYSTPAYGHRGYHDDGGGAVMAGAGVGLAGGLLLGAALSGDDGWGGDDGGWGGDDGGFCGDDGGFFD